MDDGAVGPGEGEDVAEHGAAGDGQVFGFERNADLVDVGEAFVGGIVEEVEGRPVAVVAVLDGVAGWRAVGEEVTAREGGKEMGDIERGAAGAFGNGFEEGAEVLVARAAAPVVGEFFDVGLRTDADFDEQRGFAGEGADEAEAFGARGDQRHHGGMIGKEQGCAASVEEALNEREGGGREAAVSEPFLGGVGAEAERFVVVEIFGEGGEGGVEGGARVGIESEHEVRRRLDNDAVGEDVGDLLKDGDIAFGETGSAPELRKGVGRESGKRPNDGHGPEVVLGDELIGRFDHEPRVLDVAPRAGAALNDVGGGGGGGGRGDAVRRRFRGEARVQDQTDNDEPRT